MWITTSETYSTRRNEQKSLYIFCIQEIYIINKNKHKKKLQNKNIRNVFMKIFLIFISFYSDFSNI